MSTIDDLEVYTGPLEHTDDGRLRQIICDIPIESPPFPPVKEIVGWDLPQEQQFWANIYEKIKLPESFKKIKFDNDGNPLNLTPEQFEIINVHIKRRKDGFWWYNNGQPTWITGTHYLFIVFWRLDTGIPEYRDPDRKYFWFWWFCENDPDCYGMQELGKRQSGKSAKAGICIFDRCTKGYFRMGGIQSKNDRDATSFFTKFIVRGWKFLPFFFSPLFQGTTSPRRKLEFISPSKKGKKAMVDGQVDAVDELGSIIEARPAKELAFDGESLFMYISDEGGKTPLSEANVETRWNIVKECLTFNGDIRGKALHPSTAEEMEKGGATIFKSMWIKSKYADKDEVTRRTESGLYRYFIPAFQNLKLDKFGFALEEISKQKIQADIDQVKDPAQRLALWRKNPFTVKDAFKSGGKECAFNSVLLLNAIERSEQQTHLWEDFSLDWEQQVGEGGIIKKRDTKVIATPVKGGRFHFRLMNMPRGIDANKVKRDVFGKLRPDNNLVFSGAVDSYDTIDPKTKKFSKGSVTAFQKFDPNIDTVDKPMGEWHTNRYVVWYKERPVGGPEVFYEDMIMLAHYLGIELLIEDDKPGLYHYFLKRGYEHFCAYKPESAKSSTELASGKETVNISSRILVKQAYFGHIDQYIINYHELIDCIPIAEDWLDMEFDYMTPYDLGVASGLNQLQNNKYIRMEKPIQQGLSFVRMYDRAGNELGVKH